MKTAQQQKHEQECRTIAETILDQLGGARFIAMTGARNIVALDDMGGLIRGGLQLSFSGSSKANKIVVRLMGSDTYTIGFYKVSGGDFKRVAEHEDAYAEDLQTLFARETGLYTTL